jgi:hypothetical protein
MPKVSNGQYWAIKNNLTKAEKELINYYELQWALRHHVPTVEEVATHLKIPQTSINYYLDRDPVIKALDRRGIPWRQHSQSELTATQVATAITLSNFADTRSNDIKLDQLGVNPTTYYAWLNDPQFKNLVENLADQNIKNIKPTALGELTKKINSGDWQAVKFYLETTDALNNNDTPQSEDLLRMFVEIIQRHIKDPDTIIAIANDLKLATSNRTLETVANPRQITGEAVAIDLELEDAKKKLGVL